MKQLEYTLQEDAFQIMPISNLSSLVSDEIMENEKDQVASAFSVGGAFDVDRFVDRPYATQYLHAQGALLALPFVVEAARLRPESAALSVCCYLTGFGFDRPVLFNRALPLHRSSTATESRGRARRERNALVRLFPVSSRQKISCCLADIAARIQTSDREDRRVLKKLIRWLRAL